MSRHKESSIKIPPTPKEHNTQFIKDDKINVNDLCYELMWVASFVFIGELRFSDSLVSLPVFCIIIMHKAESST